MTQTRNQTLLLALLAVALIPLEIISAMIAFETLGAIASTLYFLAIGINLLFLLIAVRSRMAAAVGLFLLALAIVPYQFALAQRLWLVQSEAAQIVSYAYEQKLTSGEYPTSLAGYRYKDPETQPYIQGFKQDNGAGGFTLCYRVGTESTSHCYSPRNGWTYYPD